MDSIYSVHRHFNKRCSAFGVPTELLTNEDDLKVILASGPLSQVIPAVRNHAIASGVIVESKKISAGAVVVISSKPGLNVAATIDEVEHKYGNFYRKLNEALTPRTDNRPDVTGGIAVPDGAVQPRRGVEMLELALSTKTKSGMSLKDALKKQGIKWNVAEPGSHVVVFTGKNGDEKWRVEPMTLSDKKVFEQTMESLWSVALGKAPNAKELERDAAQQRAQELRDHQKEISGLVDQIVGKYTEPDQEEVE